jgi:hypothetical protein
MVKSQTSNNCDKVYEYVEDMPEYNGSPNAIFAFIENDLNPIINETKSKGRQMSFSRMILTINKTDQIINIEFVDFKGDEMAKKKLIAKIMAMKNWKSATKDGVTICCKYFMPFQCVKMD